MPREKRARWPTAPPESIWRTFHTPPIDRDASSENRRIASTSVPGSGTWEPIRKTTSSPRVQRILDRTSGIPRRLRNDAKTAIARSDGRRQRQFRKSGAGRRKIETPGGSLRFILEPMNPLRLLAPLLALACTTCARPASDDQFALSIGLIEDGRPVAG